MKKVLIAPHIMANRHGPHLEVLRNSGLELVFPPRPAQMNEEELLAILPGVTASLAGSEPYTRRVLEANPGLRVIARAGVGYDAVDLTAASAQGIAVTYAPGTNHKAVAEQTFGLMLALGKELMTQNTALRSGRWLRRPSLPLRGRTLGIIGLGRIGKEVALRARAFAMPTLANDIQPDLDFAAQLDIQMVSLERLLAESDFVSLHVPLTSLTRRLMNQRTLAQMKATAFLINTARGPVVCEADLVEALRRPDRRGRFGRVRKGAAPGKSALAAPQCGVNAAHGRDRLPIDRRHGHVGGPVHRRVPPGRMARRSGGQSGGARPVPLVLSHGSTRRRNKPRIVTSQ